MATERNPFESMSQEVSNIIPMPEIENTANALNLWKWKPLKI